MRDRTLFAAGAAAIAVFGVGTIVLLSTTGRTSTRTPPQEDASDAERPAAAPAAPSGTAAPVAATEGTSSAAAGSAPAPPATSVRPAPIPEEVDPSWRETPVAFRIRELGAVAPYVHGGLRDLREELRRCSETTAAAPPGSSGSEPRAVGSPAALVLYLEAREGAIDVVEVRIDRSGGWSRDMLECCRGVLRGHEIPAPNAVSGRRYRLVYDPLQ